MNEVKWCELVRQQEKVDRMFCLYPQEDGQGFFKAKAIAYSKTLTLRVDFFEQFDISVWVKNSERLQFRYGRKLKEHECFFLKPFILFLFRYNKYIAGIVIYYLFGKMLKLAYAAHAATEAADDADATYDAADATYDAAEAAHAAAEAAHAAAEAADDAAHDAAHDAARDAAYDAHAAAYAADIIGRARDAFKHLIKWRKLYYK